MIVKLIKFQGIYTMNESASIWDKPIFCLPNFLIGRKHTAAQCIVHYLLERLIEKSGSLFQVGGYVIVQC